MSFDDLIGDDDVGDELSAHMVTIAQAGTISSHPPPAELLTADEMAEEFFLFIDPTDDEFEADIAVPAVDYLDAELATNASDVIECLDKYHKDLEVVDADVAADVCVQSDLTGEHPTPSDPPPPPDPAIDVGSDDVITVFVIAPRSGRAAATVSLTRDGSVPIGFIRAQGAMIRCNCGTIVVFKLIQFCHPNPHCYFFSACLHAIA